MEDGEGGSWDGGVHGGGRQGGDGTARAESQIHGGGVTTINTALGFIATVILWGKSYTDNTKGRDLTRVAFSGWRNFLSNLSISLSAEARCLSLLSLPAGSPRDVTEKDPDTRGRPSSFLEADLSLSTGSGGATWGLGRGLGRTKENISLVLTFQVTAI